MFAGLKGGKGGGFNSICIARRLFWGKLPDEMSSYIPGLRLSLWTDLRFSVFFYVVGKEREPRNDELLNTSIYTSLSFSCNKP
jgi:hypothetical protein